MLLIFYSWKLIHGELARSNYTLNRGMEMKFDIKHQPLLLAVIYKLNNFKKYYVYTIIEKQIKSQSNLVIIFVPLELHYI